MELFFLLMLLVLMALALGSGFPVAFALPGAAITTVLIAAGAGWLVAGNVDAYFAVGGPGQWLSAGVTNLRGVYWEPERDTLIAIPLFIFMGIMLQRSRIAEDLLITMANLFGPVPGGLGISVIFVGALLAATTGIVGATVVAMGLISLPAMMRNKYSPQLATGTIAASGTLGQIIPPSIVLIILADQLAGAADQAGTMRKALHKEATGELAMPTIFDVSPTSAGEMFLGAFVPGILLVLLYMLYIFVRATLNPAVAPAVPREGAMDRAFLYKVVLALVPPLTLIVMVLGSIIGGIATVNQAGAVGAAGATVMAGYKLYEGRRTTYLPAIITLAALILLAVLLSFFDSNIRAASTDRDRLGVLLAVAATLVLVFGLAWSAWRTIRIDDTMRGVLIETAKTTSLVFIILLGAAMLTAAFRAFGGEELVREFLTGLPGGFWVQFLIVMLVIFVMGFFLDFIEIAVVVVPIVSPILLADPGANITAVWLGVMVGLNIQTSFLTPPFGFALFYLRGVAPSSIKTIQIYRGVVAFILLQLLALGIVAAYPPLVNYLPQRTSLLSETAPPPRNPKLQYCIERVVFDELENRGQPVREALARAQALDVSGLPQQVRGTLQTGLTGTANTFELITKIHEAERAVEAAAPSYRPQWRAVRDIQKRVHDIDAETGELQTRARRMRGDDPEIVERREALQAQIAKLEEEKKHALAGIPASWAGTYKAFSGLQKAEEQARNAYRRAADQGYDAIRQLTATAASADAVAELSATIDALRSELGATPAAELAVKLESAASTAGGLPNATAIQSEISKARRAMAADAPDAAAATAALVKAGELAHAEAAWRIEAKADILPVLEPLEEATRNNIGLRQQQRFPREQALAVASCNSVHRDLSLNF